MTTQIIKLSDVLQVYPNSKSTIYNQIKENLFPSQIQLGSRSVGFISSEVEALIQARITGKSDKEIKALLIDLKTKRSEVK
jgi:prophage regulatory protein